MIKKTISILVVGGLLSGCVSNDDLMRVQSQVNQLNAQLQASENELQAVKKEGPQRQLVSVAPNAQVMKCLNQSVYIIQQLRIIKVAMSRQQFNN
ncbi:MAG: hypothetical protein CR962_01715, partial [Gammaproteobacteria bacterium]